jgi:hypothetical protein
MANSVSPWTWRVDRERQTDRSAFCLAEITVGSGSTLGQAESSYAKSSRVKMHVAQGAWTSLLTLGAEAISIFAAETRVRKADWLCRHP